MLSSVENYITFILKMVLLNKLRVEQRNSNKFVYFDFHVTKIIININNYPCNQNTYVYLMLLPNTNLIEYL